MIPFPFQAGQLGFENAQSAVTERIWMDFEGADHATVFTDIGTGGSNWTVGGGTPELTTAQILAGISSLSIPASTSYIKTAYNTANRLPPTGDWTLSFKIRASSAGGWVQGGVGTYCLSAQGTAGNASDTAFAMATNSSGKMSVILSDGATRSVILTGATTLATNTNYDFKVTRVGNTITFYINNVSDGSGTFTGTINTPAGEDWRIGAPKGGQNPTSPFWFDTFRMG